MQGVLDWLTQINRAVNGVVWGTPMLLILLGVGVYFTLQTGFFQFRKLGFLLRNTLVSLFVDRSRTKSRDAHAISQFQALATGLAATIGTGNIVGVATAVSAGGAGAVFWMWVSAFFGMMTSFAENALGIYYRRKNEKGEWLGGSMMFLEHGLGCKWLAVLFAFFSLLASFGMGNMVQINSISSALEGSFGLPKWSVGIVLAAVVGAVLLGGVHRVARVTEKLVPAMALLYMAGALAVLVMNFDQIPAAFSEIFRGAFGWRSVGGGVAGYTLSQAVRYGISRGIFSNEAGLGSSVIVGACSDVEEPAEQGMWGAFSVFFDTVVMCTGTALVILVTGAHRQGLEGVAVTEFAFASVLGEMGGKLLSISVALFAFSTVLGWSVYGSKSVEYLWGSKGVKPYQLAFALAVIPGAVLSIGLVWDLSDTFNGLMALPNLIGLILLSGVALRIYRNYCDRILKGKALSPLLSADSPVLCRENRSVR